MESSNTSETNWGKDSWSRDEITMLAWGFVIGLMSALLVMVVIFSTVGAVQ